MRALDTPALPGACERQRRSDRRARTSRIRKPGLGFLCGTSLDDPKPQIGELLRLAYGDAL